MTTRDAKDLGEDNNNAERTPISARVASNDDRCDCDAEPSSGRINCTHSGKRLSLRWSVQQVELTLEINHRQEDP